MAHNRPEHRCRCCKLHRPNWDEATADLMRDLPDEDCAGGGLIFGPREHTCPVQQPTDECK